MTKLPVCPAHELLPGERRIISTDNKITIGVFNIDGKFHALRNICPHRKAPLCKGQVTGLVTSDGPGDAQMHGTDHIIRCPWHGWEFDITTGRSVFNPHKVRVKSYPVIIDPPCGGKVTNGDEDPSVDVFPVILEDGIVTVILNQSTR